jgi:hypothetical protein
MFCDQISSTDSLNLKRNLKDIFWQTSIKDTVNYIIDDDGKIQNQKLLILKRLDI